MSCVGRGTFEPHPLVGDRLLGKLRQHRLVDEILTVRTAEAQSMARRLAREGAVFAGTSTGANVVAAIRVAESLGPRRDSSDDRGRLGVAIPQYGCVPCLTRTQREPDLYVERCIAMHRKNPSVAELENPLLYEVIDVVDHSDIHRWVGKHLFRAGWITGLYWALNLATLAVVVLFWRRAGLPWLDAFSAVSLGMLVGWLTMLPVHELVHAAAYRLVGATNVLIRYELRRATAYCLAPNQVFDAPAFAWVALSPLMVLQPLLTLLPFLADSAQFALFLAGAAMIHIGATSGDVAFVHYLWGYRTHPLYTYDDIDASKTYFVRATSGE